MTVLVNRRKLILGVGSTALLGALDLSPAYSLDFGSVFGTVLGAVGVGLFPGAAAALGGFELVRLLGNAADLAGNANNLVAQTEQLESHIDSVLTQVSATLATVQSFVQDCDNALHEIENLIQQLPGALVAAFDQVAARAAFARLRADSANMAGYLRSKGSILANKTQIQSLSEGIVTEISTIDALAPNMFQSLIQMVPGLTTWVQGYAAYNLLVPGSARGTNPWDHQVVSAIALPRINTVLQAVQQQHAAQGDLGALLPIEPGALYTFNGTSFTKTNIAFSPQYGPGEIDNGFYYTIWPKDVTPQLPPLPPGVPKPQIPPLGSPQTGDLCYLWSPPNNPRIWWELPPRFLPQPVGTGPEVLAAQQVAVIYPRLMTSTLKNVTSLNQLTEGWQIFQKAVKSNLIKDDQTRAMWAQLPVLTA